MGRAWGLVCVWGWARLAVGFMGGDWAGPTSRSIEFVDWLARGAGWGGGSHLPLLYTHTISL